MGYYIVQVVFGTVGDKAHTVALSFNFDPLVEDVMLQLFHYTSTSTVVINN